MASKITNSQVQALTLKEALKIRDTLDNHISELQKAQQADVLEKINIMLEEVNLTAADLIPVKKTRKSPGSVAPKYKDPATGKTHSGRGKPSKWMTEHISNGGNLEDLLINKEE